MTTNILASLLKSLSWPALGISRHQYAQAPPPTPATYEAALMDTYTYIENFTKERRRPPAIFEIADGLGLRYGVAQSRVEAMEFRGWLYRDVSIGAMELRGVS